MYSIAPIIKIIKKNKTALVALFSIAVLSVLAFIIIAVNHHSPQESPLHFEEREIDIGSVKPYGYDNQFEPAIAQYTFTVWNQGPVTIKSIDSDCKVCLSFDQDLVGRALSPGSTHTLKGRLKALPRTGKMAYEAVVKTFPSSNHNPIRIKVSYRSVVYPVASPAQIYVETGLSNKPQLQVHVGYVRQGSEPPLKLDEINSHFPDFAIVKKEIKSAQNTINPFMVDPPFVDEIDLTFEAKKEYGIGKYIATWSLKWMDDVPDLNIPIDIEIVAPLRPKITRVFCGILKPNELWKGEVPLFRLEGDDPTLKEIKTSQTYIQAKIIGKKGDFLEISLTAPLIAQRYEENTELVFKDSRYPAVRIPISFVVR